MQRVTIFSTKNGKKFFQRAAHNDSGKRIVADTVEALVVMDVVSDSDTGSCDGSIVSFIQIY